MPSGFFCGYGPTVGRECATLEATDQHRLSAQLYESDANDTTVILRA
jgi:hypothetical protein